MSDRLSATQAWNRARALKLHEHFQTVRLAIDRGGKQGVELARVSRILDRSLLRIAGTDDEFILEASVKTLDKEYRYWRRGGRDGQERPEYQYRPEALLCAYKPGCGGFRAMPRELIKELHRRCTLTTGGRDKHGRSPISEAWKTIRRDYELQRPLPGIDYAGIPLGAEIPWTERTARRHKPAKALRALGNRGAGAHKELSAYVSLDYSQLRKASSTPSTTCASISSSSTKLPARPSKSSSTFSWKSPAA